jgi:hypothetical protein
MATWSAPPISVRMIAREVNLGDHADHCCERTDGGKPRARWTWLTTPHGPLAARGENRRRGGVLPKGWALVVPADEGAGIPWAKDSLL